MPTFSRLPRFCARRQNETHECESDFLSLRSTCTYHQVAPPFVLFCIQWYFDFFPGAIAEPVADVRGATWFGKESSLVRTRCGTSVWFLCPRGNRVAPGKWPMLQRRLTPSPLNLSWVERMWAVEITRTGGQRDIVVALRLVVDGCSCAGLLLMVVLFQFCMVATGVIMEGAVVIPHLDWCRRCGDAAATVIALFVGCRTQHLRWST